MSHDHLVFNPPPGWPTPPDGWQPPAGWVPDPAWPEPPDGWQLWIPATDTSSAQPPPREPASGDGSRDQSGSNARALEAVVSNRDARLTLIEAENAALRARLEETGVDADALVELDDERVLQSVGVYRYHHPLENAVAYKARLTDLGARIAELVKAGLAIEKSSSFTFDNSLAKGRRMSDDLAKLMLRAYNAEADNSIRSLRLGNVLTAKKRLEASRVAIAKLGKMMEMKISDAFHALRLEEIELTADWLAKRHEEKEAAREERARLREERRVQRELAEQRAQLEKERTHLQNALDALGKTETTDADLEAKLAALDEAIAQNDYRAANIRAGYVYVISNRGAFGRWVVKIGLTRRLEPLERVSELSGASVPFPFDVHALFFSEDAVTLETELHQHFAEQAVEYGKSPAKSSSSHPRPKCAPCWLKKSGVFLEFVENPEATQYLQSVRYWKEPGLRLGPRPVGEPSPEE
jgi:hypothetical protein